MGLVHYVIGSQGEYSDRDEWVVRAFATKEDAESFRLLCAAEAVRVKAEDAAAGYSVSYAQKEGILSKYDPRCRGNCWSDVVYGVGECPFGPVPS